jgi:hypothetical protein
MNSEIFIRKNSKYVQNLSTFKEKVACPQIQYQSYINTRYNKQKTQDFALIAPHVVFTQKGVICPKLMSIKRKRGLSLLPHKMSYQMDNLV